MHAPVSIDRYLTLVTTVRCYVDTPELLEKVCLVAGIAEPKDYFEFMERTPAQEYVWRVFHDKVYDFDQLRDAFVGELVRQYQIGNIKGAEVK